MVIHTYNISTHEAEAGEFHKSEASLSLHSEFQASQNRTSLKIHIYQKALKNVKAGIHTILGNTFPFPAVL